MIYPKVLRIPLAKTAVTLAASTALAIGGVLAPILSFSASAITVTWTLNNIIFDTNSLVTGSFDYDRTTNTYSNISITATGPQLSVVPPGTITFTGGTLTGGNFESGNYSALSICTNPGICSGDYILFQWLADLTDAGGTVGLDSLSEYGSNFFSNSAGFTSGSITGAPLPTPIPFEFSPSFGLILLSVGYGVNQLHQYKKQRLVK